jgi:hypothetical protein
MATVAAEAWPGPRLGNQKPSKTGTQIGRVMVKDPRPRHSLFALGFMLGAVIVIAAMAVWSSHLHYLPS